MGKEYKLAPRSRDPLNVIPPFDWDQKNPRSIWHMLTSKVSENLKSAVGAYPELFDMDERELREKFNDEGWKVTPLLNRLRLMFWNEYDRAQHYGKNISPEHVFGGACSKQHFYTILRTPHKVAWILSKPSSYEARMEEALSHGLDQMRDVLDFDPWEVDGKGKKRLNTKLLELKMKIVTHLDVRVKGATVQRVEQKTQTVQANVTGKELKEMQSGNISEIDQRIAELEKKSLGPGAAEVIEVKEVSDETDTEDSGRSEG